MLDFEHPLLLLKDDGHRTWGLVLLTEHGDNDQAIVQQLGVEPQEVEASLEALRAGSRIGDRVFDEYFFLCAVDGPTLEAVMQCTPNSPAGQKSLLVYRDDGWLMGLWNDPSDFPCSSGLSLSSLADFYGGPISRAARARRGGLELIRGKQVLDGPYEILEDALRWPRPQVPFGLWEGDPGVRRLAAWWNEHAPVEQRHAAFARLYVWDEETGVFDALDPEEPATTAEQMALSHSMALFESPGQPTLVALFMRGRSYNTEDQFGTTVYCADGSRFWEVGAPASDVDDAYYCATALEALRELLGHAPG